MKEYIQLGPSCDMDEHGDPKPPKYVETKGLIQKGPNVIYIGKRKRSQRSRKGK